MTHAARMMRNLRAERRAAGLCPYCGERNDRPGKYYCSTCAEHHNQYSARFKAERVVSRICPRCGGELDREGFTCTGCNAKVRAATAEIKRKYREQGLCQTCGKNPPKPGAKYCAACARREQLRRFSRTAAVKADTNTD